MDTISFVTQNEIKIREIKEIFSDISNKRFFKFTVVEILSSDIEEIIKEKAASAYKFAQVPVIVEHGGLYIDYLRKYPGPLSKPMWDILEDNICKLIPENETRNAKAFSSVCYCDGRKRIFCTEYTEGIITEDKGRGDNGFQWDHIFIPNDQNGQYKTYAEMEQTEKLNYSQAAKAYRALRKKIGF